MTRVRQIDRGISLSIVPPDGGVIVVNPIPPPGFGDYSPQMHIRFSATKSVTSEPNRGSIELINLGDVLRMRIASTIKRPADALERATNLALAKIDARFAAGDPTVTTVAARSCYVTLSAGYGAALSQVIEGQGTNPRSRRRGTEWTSTIEVGDGELGTTQGVANRAFVTGTPAGLVIRYLATCMGARLMQTSAVAALDAFLLSGPLVVIGRAREALSDLLAVYVDQQARPPEWWIDDGQLWIVERGAPLPGPPIVVSPTSVPGVIQLLESPEALDDGGIRVRCQLQPAIRPGFTVQIVGSRETAGTYRIEQVTHTGDNRGGAFETQAIARQPFALS